MTTNIDFEEEDFEEMVEDFEEEEISKVIVDLSYNIKTRIHCLERLYDNEGMDIIEHINRLSSMYQITGIKLLEEYLHEIVINSKLPIILKLESIKTLLEYQELLEDSDNEMDDEELEEFNKKIIEKNRKRRINAYISLDNVCSNMNTTPCPTPCRVEAFSLLMYNEEYKLNVNNYFKEFVNDQQIDCDFRYKTILSLEKNNITFMREKLNSKSEDKNIVGYVYERYKTFIKQEFPKFKPDVDNCIFYEFIINRLSYTQINELYKMYISEDCITPFDFFIKEAQFSFLFFKNNMTFYKILAGQYLLQKYKLEDNTIIEQEILSFARDNELDFNLRADASDVLMQLGSNEMKTYGREIITELGLNGSISNTVFDNSQNVHTEEVESSVSETIEFFALLPIHKVNKQPITFNFIDEQIRNLLKKQKEDFIRKKNCYYCKNGNDKEYFCNQECNDAYLREEKIKLALNRILLDRALYSKYNNTLVNILLKVWSYMETNEHKEEMTKRMLEELEEMSGTCSSGFASRLINVISGFGDFGIRISWEEQIIANFYGRLNASVRKITNHNSIFYKEKLDDVITLWLHQNNDELKKYTKENTNMKDIIHKFLENNKEEKIQNCVESFSESVINEMINSSSESENRQHFSLFFRSYVAVIREEMYQEFKDYMDDSDFDLYMRKAIMYYEGIKE